MITRTRFSTACLAFAIVSLCLPKLSAQTVAPAQNGKHYEPLQMLIAYGDGKQKRRVSHQGVVEPVGVPLGQPVAITLQFLRKRAGSVVEIVSWDGAVIDLQRPATISAEGTVSFTFQAGGAPGLYRLTVNGPQQYELSLYGVAPTQPSQTSGN